MSDALLEVENLTCKFGGLTAVKEVTAAFAAGQITAIIGPNGAGKTTFFNLIAGVHRPTAGRIRFKGQDVTGLAPDRMARRGIARTFQTTSLFDAATVLDNLIVGHRLRTRSGLWDALIGTRRLKNDERACREKAREALDFVGLAHLERRIAGDISQEERKRVAFAMALATDPELLLLDEPAGGVNPEETQGLADLIGKLVRHGKTVCLIEHKMDMIMQIADKIVVLNNGARIAEGAPDEIRANPAVIDAYLGAHDAAAEHAMADALEAAKEEAHMQHTQHRQHMQGGNDAAA